MDYSIYYDQLVGDMDLIQVSLDVLNAQTYGYGIIILYFAVLVALLIKTDSMYIPLIISIAFAAYIPATVPVEVQKFAYLITGLVIAGLFVKLIYDNKS